MSSFVRLSEAYKSGPAETSDIEALAALEAESFPEDEAASEATIRNRQTVANRYFYTVKDACDRIVGFVNGTCAHGLTIHHESMSEHVPDGKTLVIHSVTVAPSHRRKGLGSSMLQAYVETMINDRPEIELILLLSKGYLLKFYASCGFSLVEMSSVQHGKVRRPIMDSSPRRSPSIN
jgi:ribosomal protein S18 acetylase RimI-like enzyme